MHSQERWNLLLKRMYQHKAEKNNIFKNTETWKEDISYLASNILFLLYNCHLQFLSSEPWVLIRLVTLENECQKSGALYFFWNSFFWVKLLMACQCIVSGPDGQTYTVACTNINQIHTFLSSRLKTTQNVFYITRISGKPLTKIKKHHQILHLHVHMRLLGGGNGQGREKEKNSTKDSFGSSTFLVFFLSKILFPNFFFFVEISQITYRRWGKRLWSRFMDPRVTKQFFICSFSPLCNFFSFFFNLFVRFPHV